VKRFSTRVLTASYLVCGMLAVFGKPGIAGADEPTAVQADHEFLQAAAKGDAAAAGKFLDGEFTWTNTAGRTYSRADVLSSLPKPALGGEAGVNQLRQTHNQVEAIMSDQDKIHVLRVWVKRAGAWRLLVYHEVVLGREGGGSTDTGTRTCENPCKTVPFKPKSEAEQEVLASWEALETAVANHDAFNWASHIASEFTMLGSTNDHPLTKADRIATLNLQKQTGRGALPPPVIAVQTYEFGDSIVMTSLHQPYTGKPVRVTRLWIRRDGKWIMTISYQTTVEASAAKNG
jgi:hypothetical protein